MRKKIRLKPTILILPFLAVICFFIAKSINNMIDDYVGEIVSKKYGYSADNYMSSDNAFSTLYSWQKDETFSDGGYYYNQLDDNAQITYQILYKAIKNRDTEVPLGTDDREQLVNAYNFITYDHPEIFYTAGYDITEYTFSDGSSHLTFTAKYTKTREEQKQMEYYIGLYINSILENIDVSWSEHEKIKYVYDRIIQETTYDLENVNAYNIYAIAYEHAGVCEGYSKMFKYLMDRIGIPCIVIPGYIKSNGSNHIWNAVYVNDNWYYIDPTWGDIQFDGIDQKDAVRYDYFCVNYEQLSTTHAIDPAITPPVCESIDENYYVQEGNLFSTITDDHIDYVIKSLIKKGSVTFRCSSLETYEDAYRLFIMEDVIHSKIGFDTKIKYTINKNIYTFTFWTI